MLEHEYHYYKAHEAELLEKHGGKFIGIVGDEIVGIYSSELDGYSQLKKKYGLGKFLIQHCIPASTHIQRYHSRVAFR